MANEPNCKKCNDKLYYIEDGEAFECDCVYLNQLRYKLDQSGVGAHDGFPPMSIAEEFDKEEDNLLPYLYVKTNGDWSQRKFNSILGYCLVNFAYELRCQYFSTNGLREYLRQNDFVMDINCDLLILSYGLSGMFEGIGDQGEWGRDQNRSIVQRAIRRQISERKPMWVFGCGMNIKHDEDIEAMMVENNFFEMDFKERL